MSAWRKMNEYEEGEVVWVAFFDPEDQEYYTHAVWKYRSQSSWITHGNQTIVSNFVPVAWQEIHAPQYNEQQKPLQQSKKWPF